MIERLVEAAVQVAPIRKIFWLFWYQYLARRYAKADWQFMNYGFASHGPYQLAPRLNDKDEAHRYRIQLYDFVATRVPIKGRSLLEVGSGRGGGASYVKRYLEPSSILGFDLSSRAIRLSRSVHRLPGVSFIRGDAEHLPIEDGSVDVVLSVECSHCFGSMHRFLSEAKRVLRPGGHLLLADLRAKEAIPGIRKALSESGLKQQEMLDISENVWRAMQIQHDVTLALVKKVLPRLLWSAGFSFAGTEGSTVLEELKSGERVYFCAVMQKPASASRSPD